MTRPFLIVHGVPDRDIRVCFEFDGAVRDAKALTALLFGLAWPAETKLRVSLSQSEELRCSILNDQSLSRALSGDAGLLTAPRPGRGEISISSPVERDRLRDVVKQAVETLRSMSFRSIHIHPEL